MEHRREHLAFTGARIVAIDGRTLGSVLEARADRFLAATPDGICWLTQQCVFTAVGAEVTLICDASGLRRYVIGVLPPFQSQADSATRAELPARAPSEDGHRVDGRTHPAGHGQRRDDEQEGVST